MESGQRSQHFLVWEPLYIKNMPGLSLNQIWSKPTTKYWKVIKVWTPKFEQTKLKVKVIAAKFETQNLSNLRLVSKILKKKYIQQKYVPAIAGCGYVAKAEISDLAIYSVGY